MKQYSWSRIFSWGLTISVALAAVSGVLAVFLPAVGFNPGVGFAFTAIFGFAGVTLFSLALANVAAAHAQRALVAYEHFSGTFWLSFACAVGFCLASVVGVHLGWAVLAARVSTVVLPDPLYILLGSLFLAFAKPAMQWVIEGRLSIDEHFARLADEREHRMSLERRMGLESSHPGPVAAKPSNTDMEPAPAPLAADANVVTLPAKKAVNPLAAASAAGAAIVVAGAIAAPVAAATHDVIPSGTAVEKISIQTEDQGIWSPRMAQRFAHVRAMWLNQIEAKDIVAATGYPKATVYKWVGILEKGLPVVELGAPA